MKLKKPMPLLLENNDIISIHGVTYRVSSVFYDGNGLATHIHGTKINTEVVYELGRYIEEEL